MNYSKLSDFEINKLVSKVLLDDKNHWSTWITNDGRSKTWFVDESKNNEPIPFNPCSNPADAWPIILDNKISVIYNRYDEVYMACCKYSHTWGCESGDMIDFDNDTCNENPLRAAMITFLKMSED